MNSESIIMLQDAIRGYIHGNLDADQLKSFTKELNVNSELQAEVKRYKELDMIRRSQGILKAQPLIRQIIREPIEPDFDQYDSLKSDTPMPRVFSKWAIGSAAVIAVILLLGGALWQRSAQQQRMERLQETAAPFIKPYQNIVNFNHPTPNEAFPKAMQEYDNGRYENTIKILDADVLSRNNTYANFYTGMSQIMLKRYSSAINPLRSAAKSKSVIASTAQWYLALTYLEIGEAQEATSLLQNLRNDADYGTKAQLLLQKISSI